MKQGGETIQKRETIQNRETLQPETQSGLNPDLLKACIHCGMCLPACPTYLATGSEAESPRGRLYMMGQWQQGNITGVQLSPHLNQCLGCQACQTACPSGVQYGELLFQSRETLQKEGVASRSFPQFLKRQVKRFSFQYLLPFPKRLKWLMQGLRLYQKTPLSALMRQSGLLSLLGLSHMEALMPQVPEKPSPLDAGMTFGDPRNPGVALMTGCVMDALYHPVHQATIEVLVANDYFVMIPPQNCCGALAHHAGETDIALSLAEKNVSQMMGSPVWIVLNSAGCGATMKDYGHLLHSEEAKTFSSKVIDIMALLSKKPLKQPSQPLNLTVTYHPPCHLHHAQGVKQEPLDVLDQIPGLKRVPLAEADQCCGSAGIYNIEQPELSQEILARKLDNLEKTGAEVVVSGNPGCMLQLVSGLNQRGVDMTVMHPIELLAMAYRSGAEADEVIKK
jgi:glycolate oxidase iron-sulfur subunit